MYKVHNSYEAIALCPRESHVMPLMECDVKSGRPCVSRDEKGTRYVIRLYCYGNVCKVFSGV